MRVRSLQGPGCCCGVRTGPAVCYPGHLQRGLSTNNPTYLLVCHRFEAGAVRAVGPSIVWYVRLRGNPGTCSHTAPWCSRCSKGQKPGSRYTVGRKRRRKLHQSSPGLRKLNTPLPYICIMALFWSRLTRQYKQAAGAVDKLCQQLQLRLGQGWDSWSFC